MYPNDGDNPNFTTRAERVRPDRPDGWALGHGDIPADVGPAIVNERAVQWDGTAPLTLQLPDGSDIRSIRIHAVAETISVFAGAQAGAGALLFSVTAKNLSETLTKGINAITLVASAPFGLSIRVFISGSQLTAFINDSPSTPGAPPLVITPAPGSDFVVSPEPASIFTIAPEIGAQFQVVPTSGAIFNVNLVAPAASSNVQQEGHITLSGGLSSVTVYTVPSNIFYLSYFMLVPSVAIPAAVTAKLVLDSNADASAIATAVSPVINLQLTRPFQATAKLVVATAAGFTGTLYWALAGLQT